MAKFCTKCGKRLEEGEVCTCQQQPQQAQPQKAQVQQAQPQQPQQAQAQQPQQAQPHPQQMPNSQYQPQQQNQQAQQQTQQQREQQQYQQYQQYQQQQYNQNQQYQQSGNQTREAEWFNQKSAKVTGEMKNMFSEILPILKHPVTEAQSIGLKHANSMAVGLEFIIAKTVIFVVMVLIGLARLSDSLGMLGGMVEIPYMKCIFITLLLTLGVDCLEAVVMKAISSVSNGLTTTGAMFTSVGARALYDSIIAILVGIMSLISVQFAMIVLAGTSIILPYIQFGTYRALVRADENKKVYAFFLAKLCIAIVVYLIVYIAAKDIITSLAGGAMNSLNSFNSLGGLDSLF